MRTHEVFVVITLAVFAASCGGRSNQLQSLAITPAEASAASPSSSVQFKALGTFTDGHQAEVAAEWTLTPFCPPRAPCPVTMPPPGWIKLSNSGVAQCTAGGPASTIFATAPVNTNTSTSEITFKTKTISAKAQLTCTQAAS